MNRIGRVKRQTRRVKSVQRKGMNMDDDSAYSEEAKTFVDGLNIENQYLVRTLQILVPGLDLDALRTFSTENLEGKLESVFCTVRDFVRESRYLEQRWDYFEKKGNKPYCFGKQGYDCLGCFYGQAGSEECLWKTLQDQGHSHECIFEMIYSGKLCSCGIGHKGDEEKKVREVERIVNLNKNYIKEGHSEVCAHEQAYFHKSCTCGLDATKKQRKQDLDAKVKNINRELKRVLKNNKEVREIDFSEIVCRVFKQAGKLQDEYVDYENLLSEKEILDLMNEYQIIVPGWKQAVTKIPEDKEYLGCGLIFYLLDRVFGNSYESYQHDHCIFVDVDGESYVLIRQLMEVDPYYQCFYAAALRDSPFGSEYKKLK